MDLKTYLLSLDMPTRLTLAEACGTSYPHLRNIAYGSKPCGEALAINLERETARAVRCEDLRPDVDWAYLRGTAPVSSQGSDEDVPILSPGIGAGEHSYQEPVHDDRRGSERRDGDRRRRGEQRQAERRKPTDRRDCEA